jgi:trehalose 6-phosphate synthase
MGNSMREADLKDKERRIVIVSNRLPITIRRDGLSYHIRPSSGGLVTALQPLLRESTGVWIGWTGTDELPEIERLLEEYPRQNNFALVPIYMTTEERQRFYFGFSNEVLWPLFHDLQSRCNFDPSY